MKNIFLLSLLSLGLVACQTHPHTEYSRMGHYGFTYDLDNSPSPLQDTSYRPLTTADLAAPIIIYVTNNTAPTTTAPAGNTAPVTVPASRAGATP